MRNRYQHLFVATTPSGKRLRILPFLAPVGLLLIVLAATVLTSVHAKTPPAPLNKSTAFNVRLDLVSIQTVSIPLVTQKGITIQSVLHNNTSSALSIRTGCVGPLVRLHAKTGAKVFKIKLYVNGQQANTTTCNPTITNIPANSAQTLSNTYVLLDVSTSPQAVPNGAYQVEEELTYTVVAGDPAKRYKRLSDNSLIDTFPTRRVYSNSQLLGVTATNTSLTMTNTSTTAAATFMQSSSGSSGIVNPSLSFTYNVQVGDLLVATMNCGNSSLNLPNDSARNTWTTATSQISGLGYRQGMYYAVAATSGPDTITFTCNTKSTFAIVEFSGLKGQPLEQVSQTRGLSYASNVTTTYQTAQAYDLVIGFVGDNLTLPHSYTITSSGYTEIQSITSTYGNLELAYTATSASGIYTTSWQSLRPVAWGALQATFQVAPPPLTYPQNSQVGPFSPKVLIIDYNTSGQASDGSAALTQRLIGDLATGSNFHGNSFSSANFQIYARYVENNPPPLRAGATHGNGYGDYQAIYTKYNICNLAATQGVNFVWIWASGSEQGGIYYAGDFFEWVTTGPTFYQTYWSNAPTCGSHTMVTFGYNYSRATAEALHSTGHYMENVLQFAFGPGDYSGPGGTDMYDLFDGQLSRYNGYNGPLNTQSASCGDVHFPPNTVTSYDYGNNTIVLSDCNTYNPGNPSSEFYSQVSDGNWQGIPCDPSLGFNTFDCNQESYLMWWMQNMPGYNNGTLDLYQYSMPNWWQYITALDTTIRYN